MKTRSADVGASGWMRVARRLLAVVLVVAAGVVAYQHRTEITQASNMLSSIRPAFLVAAIAAELASMVVFARLQRWLLKSGGVRISLLTMVEMTLAGNAMATSLPGGAAWSATWAYGQLRRRGANRVLAGWVVLVAGALSSFALFVIVVVGVWVAGGRGPFASLRWLAAALAAIPVVAMIAYTAGRRWTFIRGVLAGWWQAACRFALPRFIDGVVRRTVDNLGLVRPGFLGWLEAFGLAAANWFDDAVCLVLCIAALRVAVPWRDVLVIYGFTQISASLPVTPGGLGVVEGSMTALLIAYGMRSNSAFAVVLLYRIVSFWGLVPVGWGAWFAIEFAKRGGLRQRAHPWAWHLHGPAPAAEVAALGPERIANPEPCVGCSDQDHQGEPTLVAGPGSQG